MKNSTNSVDVVIFAVGIVVAAAVGVYAFRTVGPYGDGAFGSGFRRIADPTTGRSMIFRDSETSQGRLRRLFDESFHVREIQVDSNRDGVVDGIIAIDAKTTTGTIDSDGDKIIDRWEHYDPKGTLTSIGASSRHDGIEDSRSYLDGDGLLIRIETDFDRDGFIDKREVFGPSADRTRRVLVLVESEFNRSNTPRVRLRYLPDGSLEGYERR